MIIGTVRPEEARAFDSHEGYHSFHADETQEPYGSFEVFFKDENEEDMGPGWYWWSCFPGCMPDSYPQGPFAYSIQAHQDADEWSPTYNDLFEETAQSVRI